MIKQVARYATIVLATLAVVFLLWQFRSAVWIFLFSLAAAATFRPLIQNLVERGFSLSVSLLLVYGVGLFLLGVLLIIVSLLLLTELQQAANAFAIGYEHIKVVWPEGTSWQQSIASRLPESADLYDQILGGEDFSNLPTMIDILSGFFEYIAYLVMIIFLGIYWTVDQVRFERLWLSLLSVEYRGAARELWRQIEENVGAYTRSELVQSLLAGFLLWLGYWVIGLNYPTILAIIGAVMWLIPILGIVLAFVPVVIVGLTSGLFWGVTAGLYTLVVFWILEYLIEPHLFDRRRYSSLLLVLVMIAFIELFGLIGLVISPPVAVFIQILFGWFMQRRIPRINGKTIPQIVELQERVATIETNLATDEEEPSPQLVSMIERLKGLLDEAAKTSLAKASK
ncbi:MAG: AI-2E family transporter [Anaerolineae bacterium]|nr:AI-2E family transporter [Anaerolineae bacterium]